jgi:hypothetical protein
MVIRRALSVETMARKDYRQVWLCATSICAIPPVPDLRPEGQKKCELANQLEFAGSEALEPLLGNPQNRSCIKHF